MKNIILVISFLTVFSFTSNSQESCLEKSFNLSFIDLIRSEKDSITKEVKRYINNEAKIIFFGRKEFFSLSKLKPNTELNVIEIFDTERPDNIYSIAIKNKSVVYYLVMDESLKSKFIKIDYDTFKTEHNMFSCMFEKIEKDHNSFKNYEGASFHFTAIISRINAIYDIKTYIAKDICNN